MFLVTDRPQTYLLFTISKDHNSTSTHSRVTFLALCVPSRQLIFSQGLEIMIFFSINLCVVKIFIF